MDREERDVTGDTRWMTYTELAETLGIARPSAKRLAIRHRWQRQPGNDRAARVAVPLSVLENKGKSPATDTGDGVSESTGDSPRRQSLQNQALRALESAVGALKEQLTDLRNQRDRAQAELEAQRERAEERETDLRAQCDRLAERIAELERAGERPAHKRWWPFRRKRKQEEAAKLES